MALDRDDSRTLAESTVISTIFIVLVLVLALGLGVWLFNRTEVPSLTGASRAPTTQPVPKDPNITVIPKSTETSPSKQ